jgi:hypothetical protein
MSGFWMLDPGLRVRDTNTRCYAIGDGNVIVELDGILSMFIITSSRICLILVTAHSRCQHYFQYLLNIFQAYNDLQ